MSEVGKRVKTLRSRIERLQGVLYSKILSYISNKLKITDGGVEFSPINIGALLGMERTLNKELEKEVERLQKYLIKDIKDYLKQETLYFNKIDVKAVETSEKVIKRAEKHLSLKVLQETDLTPIFQDVKTKAISLISRQGDSVSLQELRMFLEKNVVEKDQVQKYWSRWTYDIYQQYERVASNEIRKDLDLQWAMYEGGEIETSRCFCLKRNGRLFHISEIQSWADISWAGKSEIGYDPIVDLGGFNCRHKLRWVSNEFAERMEARKGVNPDVVCGNINEVEI
jgi:hypothetical protein